MIPANDNRNYSNLPTYHAVRMEATHIAAEARHAEWLAQIAKLRGQK
jgi:hypothetical protein